MNYYFVGGDDTALIRKIPWINFMKPNAPHNFIKCCNGRKIVHMKCITP